MITGITGAITGITGIRGHVWCPGLVTIFLGLDALRAPLLQRFVKTSFLRTRGRWVEVGGAACEGLAARAPDAPGRSAPRRHPRAPRRPPSPRATQAGAPAGEARAGNADCGGGRAGCEPRAGVGARLACPGRTHRLRPAGGGRGSPNLIRKRPARTRSRAKSRARWWRLGMALAPRDGASAAAAPGRRG